MDDIIVKILEENEKINLLYKNVKEKIEKQDKQLIIRFENREDDLGITYNHFCEVMIILKEELKNNKDKLIAVFVHELGEADYISNKLPVIYDTNIDSLSALTLCITHNHINRIIENYKLNNEIRAISLPESESKPQKVGNKFFNIIHLIYYMITYNLDNEYMTRNLNWYFQYENSVNKIISDIRKVNTVDCEEEDVKKIEKQYEEIINYIKEISDYDKIKLKSNLTNTVIFKENNFTIKLDIDNNICKNILSNQKKFSNIKISSDGNSMEIEGIFNDNLIVNDTYRYKVSFEEKYPKFCEIEKIENFMAHSNYDEYPISYESEIKSIVIILESPHKDEYFEGNKQLITKGPAQGDTGIGIYKNIRMLLNELQVNYNYDFNKDIYRIILVNSIRYQTSLYSLHGKGLTNNHIYENLRNDIWENLWNIEEIKKSLKDRIKKIDPYLIINASTQFSKEQIGDILKKEGYENVVKTNHPCTWKGFGIES